MLYESPMSPRTGPAIPHAGPFDRTLAEERARNTRRINTFRFQALTAFLAPVYYVLLLFLAVFSLERAHILFATAVATGAETLLGVREGFDVGRLLVSALVSGCAGVLCAYASGRVLHLLALVSQEQLRRERLGRYFSPQVTEHLEQHGDLAAAGESREVTILFIDLRDFTALSERLTSVQVVTML